MERRKFTRGIEITGFPSTVPDQVCWRRASSNLGSSLRTTWMLCSNAASISCTACGCLNNWLKSGKGD
jgi:hypothetical protein